MGLVLLSVAVTAIAQIVLKAGMSGTSVQRAIAGGFGLRTIVTTLFDPLVFGGLVLYFGAALVWLLVLSKAQVSLVYPFVALGFVVTALLGNLLLGESLSAARIAAILLICIGVTLLARS